ncbi:MAG: hypothetical protein J7J51_05695 [Candidatus Omnitrophica bacterium]|nr:hypothetical protein [Candidatus Omnitrophota bacterium]
MVSLIVRLLFLYLLFRFLFKLILGKETFAHKGYHKRNKNDKSDYKDAVDVEFEEIE